MFVIDFIINKQVALGILGAVCLFAPWKQRRSWFALRALVGTVLLFIAASHIPTSVIPLRLLSYTVLTALLIWVCFDCDVVHVIFSATCAYAVQHLTSKLAYMGIQIQFVRGNYDKGSALILLLLANVLVCTPIFLGFTRRILREGQLVFDSAKTVMYSGAFLLVAVFLSYLLESNLDRTAETYITSYLALNAFCALFALAILSMEFSSCTIKRLENANMILEQMLESDKLQYEQAKRDMEEISIRYHDLKQQYLCGDGNENAEQAANLKAMNLRYYTGNKALDIVLTQKAALCEKADIQFICSVDGACLSGIKQYHIYSLLGNALDNGIECLSKVEDKSRRVISLSIGKCNDMVVIRVENYTPTLPVLRDGALVTTKSDATGHGYGMKSIKNVAEIYGGIAEYFVEDEIFYLLVTFPYAGPLDAAAAAN